LTNNNGIHISILCLKKSKMQEMLKSAVTNTIHQWIKERKLYEVSCFPLAS
jgi:hypothetical protein